MKLKLFLIFIICALTVSAQNKSIYTYLFSSFGIYTHPETKLKGVLLQGEGSIVINAQYEDIKESSYYGYIAKYNGKYGVIDRYNNVIIPFNFDDKINYYVEYAQNRYFIIEREGLHGIALANGEIITEPTYNYCSKGPNDMFFVSYDNKKWGLIDAHDNEIIPISMKYKKISKEAKELPVYNQSDYDEANRILELELEKAKEILSEVYVKEKNGKFGIFDKIGRDLTSYKYDSISPFIDDTATVYIGSKVGTINKSGIEKKSIEFETIKNGIEASNKGNITLAINQYIEALNYNKYNPSIYNLIGKIYLSQGHFDKAIELFNTSIQLKKIIGVRNIGNSEIEDPDKNKYDAELAAGYRVPVKEESTLDVLVGIVDNVSKLATTVQGANRSNQNNNTSNISANNQGGDINSYSIPDPMSNNTKSKTSAKPNNQRSASEVGNQNADNRTYMNWETQLINMNSNYDSYNDSRRRTIQQQMRTLRTKWESKGYNWFKSSWETWDGKKR